MVNPSALASDVPTWIKFCSNTAPMASLVVFMAPFPTIQQITKDKSVGSLPLLPYSSMISSCILWFVYGLLIQEKNVWFTNLVGFFFGLFYFAKFIKYVPPKSVTLPGTVKNHTQACLGIVAATSIWVLVCYLTVQRNNMWMPYAASLVGNVAVVFCLLMFASPLSALKTVLRTRSARSIPLPFTLATVLNCFLWSVAGLGEFRDFNIYFPNLLGLAFGLIQVALKIVFENGPSAKSEDQIDLVM